MFAPTLFSLYLSAMLEVAFSDIQKDVYIQMRKEADLFNEADFKSKNKSVFKRELFFTDDSIPVAHRCNDIQTLMDRFSPAAIQFSRRINIKKKTEYLYQHLKFLRSFSLPTINKELLVQSRLLNTLSAL